MLNIACRCDSTYLSQYCNFNKVFWFVLYLRSHMGSVVLYSLLRSLYEAEQFIYSGIGHPPLHIVK